MTWTQTKAARLALPISVLVLGLVGAGSAVAAAGGFSNPGFESMMSTRGFGGFNGGGMMGWGNAASVCGPTAGTGQVVRYRAMDSGRMMGGVMMRLMPYAQVIQAGAVTLELTNLGSRPHELLVFPLANGANSGRLTVLSNDRVSETPSIGEVEPVCTQDASVDGIASGNVARVTLDLAPGRYEVLCNLPGHYRAGMWSTLVVR